MVTSTALEMVKLWKARVGGTAKIVPRGEDDLVELATDSAWVQVSASAAALNTIAKLDDGVSFQTAVDALSQVGVVERASVVDIRDLWSHIADLSPSRPDTPRLEFTIELGNLFIVLRERGLALASPSQLLTALTRTEVYEASPWLIRFEPSTGALTFLPKHPSPPTPVRFRMIKLRHVGPLASLDLKGPEPRSECGQWILLIGDNGTGKSSVLRALVLAMAELGVPTSLLALRPDRPLISQGEQEATVLALSSGGDFTLSLGKSPTTGELIKRLEVTGSTRPLLAAYGCTRGSALGRDGDVDLSDVGAVHTLFDERAGLIRVETWLKQLALDATRNDQDRGFFNAVVETLQMLLPGVDGFDVGGDAVLVWGPGVGDRVPFASLSDGYLTMAGWVVDMIARWADRQRRAHRELRPGFQAEMTGLVLVDEIDLHLHPRWQRDLVATIRKLFPRMSFVVTTHNPLTLLGAQPGEVFVLRRDEEGVSAIQVDVPAGTRADEVLTGEWFGLHSTLDAETLRLLSQHRRLLRDGDSSGKIRELETQLRARLSQFNETSIEKLAYSVAAELLDDSDGELTVEERRHARARIRDLVRKKINE